MKEQLSVQSLITFISAKLGVGTDGLSSSDSLFTSGVLDSFSMVDLILFIETSGGVRLEPSDITIDNLDSVDRIVSLVESYK